ncbi:MAG: M4 family metallopeptidase, partial [Verrucomicrobia bacterium]|nr:M4 family metallopeptidase [Verrucomicrobiota bacterium]
MRVRSVFVPVACAAVLFFASSSSARAVNKTGAPGASKRASGAAATAQVRSSTATQQALVDEARRAGYAVEWDGALAVPNSIRGADLSTRQAFSTGRGLAAIGRGQYAEDAVAVMDNLAGLFRITNAAEEFRSRKTQGDALGFHHVRLQQMYRGLPVVGGEVIVHFNKADAAYEVNGRYVPDLAVGIAPALDAARALAIAQADLQALKKPVGALDEAVSLVVYAREDPPRLAQALTLTYRDAAGEAGRWRYWIDALDGSILQRFNDIHNIPPPSGSGSPATITGALLAGESGVVTNFIGWHDSINPYYYLHNTSRVWIVENVAASGYPDANTYAHRTTNDWGTSDRVEISAARNFDVTLNYYRQRHALFSFDGAGAMARANVHEGVNYVNAYWDGDEFYFGDGDGVIANSLAVLDVCGHEFAHAVTEYSADLVYAGESGALNESFSDVMGTCVEFFGQADDRVSYPAKNPGRADWLMGEDCWLISTALRDMRNPANTVTVGAGSQQPTRYQGTHWDPLQEVHQNSGVQNFFFYLLCDGGNGNNDGINYSVTGIGITNAEQVAHRALTVYCTPNTGYRAVRGAWLSAALDLNPAWASAVRAAWDAVGVQPVSITPAGSAAYTGSEGGPFLPATFVYTITNADNTAVGWGVSHTQAWVTVTPGGGSIPAFGSQAVTVSVSGVAAGLTSGTYLDQLI